MSVRAGEPVDSLLSAGVELNVQLQSNEQQNLDARWRRQIQQCSLDIGVVIDIGTPAVSYTHLL